MIKKSKRKMSPRVLRDPGGKGTRPLVTIVTVCKNAEETIERAVRSVYEQTYDDIEYVIVDGESTDCTEAIIARFRECFGDRLHFISEADSGMYDAMNKGIRMSSGEIIGILNSDDWYEPNAVQIIVAEYLKNGLSVYYGILRYFEANRAFMVKSVEPLCLLRGIMLPHPTCFVPRSIYDDYGAFDSQYRLSADYELFLRYYLRGVRFIQVDRVISNFRLGGRATKNDSLSTIETLAIMKRYGLISTKKLVLYRIKHRLADLFTMKSCRKIKDHAR